MKHNFLLYIAYIYIVMEFLSRQRTFLYNLRGILLLTIPTLGLLLPQPVNSVLIILLLVITIIDDETVNLKMIVLLIILQIYFFFNIRINFSTNSYLKEFSPYIGMLEYMSYFIYFYVLSIEQKYKFLLVDIVESVLTFSIVVFIIGVFDWIYIFFNTGFFSRATSIFSNANGFGPYSAFILILSIICSKKTIKHNLVKVLSIISIFLSAARVVWVAMFLAGVYYLIKYERFWFIKQFKYLLMAILLYLALPPSITSFVSTRILTMFESGDASTSDRINLFKFSIVLFTEKPFFGHGIRSFYQQMVNRMISFNSVNVFHPHNALFESLVTLGTVGTFIVAYVYFAFSNNIKRNSREQTEKKIEEKYSKTFFVFIICFSMFSRLLNHYEITIYFLLTSSVISNYKFSSEKEY